MGYYNDMNDAPDSKPRHFELTGEMPLDSVFPLKECQGGNKFLLIIIEQGIIPLITAQCSAKI